MNDVVGVRAMRGLLVALLLTLAAGCSSLLPHGESRVVSHWASFAEAQAAFDQIVPYQTRKDDLDTLGFSPVGQPNVRILNYADIAERFMLVSFRDENAVPVGLRDCLEHSEGCHGYEVKRRMTSDQRYGNFLADFLNFRRKTVTRGWEFNALIVLIDGTVVYRMWSGTPDIHQHQDVTNPLGPLQGLGGALTPRPEL